MITVVLVVVFDDSGMIRVVVFDDSGLIRVVVFDDSGLMRTQSGDVLLFYVSFSLLLRHPERSRMTYLLFYVSFSLLLLFFHTFLSALFLGDALIKLDETL